MHIEQNYGWMERVYQSSKGSEKDGGEEKEGNMAE